MRLHELYEELKELVQKREDNPRVFLLMPEYDFKMEIDSVSQYFLYNQGTYQNCSEHLIVLKPRKKKT